MALESVPHGDKPGALERNLQDRFEYPVEITRVVRAVLEIGNDNRDRVVLHGSEFCRVFK